MKKIALGLVVILAFVAACASLPIKQQAVQGLQASELALEAAHHAERALCSPTAIQTAPITHCDGPAAAAIGLTDDRHRQIARLFSQAFDAEIKAATALMLWRAGEPWPADLIGYQRVIADLLSGISHILPSTERTVEKVQQAVDEAAKIAALMGVK